MKIVLACPVCGLTDWSYNGGSSFTCDCCGREVASEEMVGVLKDVFAITWFENEDIIKALDDVEIEADEKSVKYWRSVLDSSYNQQRIAEAMIEAGWNAIYEIINEVNSAKAKEVNLDEKA